MSCAKLYFKLIILAKEALLAVAIIKSEKGQDLCPSKLIFS